MIDMEEIWKSVPFDVRYEVSSHGRICGGITGSIKKLSQRPDGYYCVAFYYSPNYWAHIA